MLACARIGAPHTVVFGGFSADALASRIDDCQAKVVITADGGYRRGAPSALKPAVDEARTKTRQHGREGARRTAYRAGRRLGRRRRRVVARRRSTPRRPSTTPEAFDAEHPLYVMYTSGHDRQAQGHPAHHRRLPGRHVVHALGGLRPQAGDRRLLVHRRHRLGHRPLLHRLRAAGQRRDPGDVRRHPGQPRSRAAGGRSSRTTASRSSTPRPPRSGPS